MAISCTSRLLSSICRAECESVDNTDAQQLATVHYCTSTQKSGGGSVPAMPKADRLAADRLQNKCRRVEETNEEYAAWL